MYPFGDFSGNLAAFCGVLRREYGFRLGPGELHDAARVLHHIDVADQFTVRHAWRAILSTSRDTAAVFDDAFDGFFFPGPRGVPQEHQPPLAGREERPGDGALTGEHRPATDEPLVEPELDDSGAAADAGLVVVHDETADAEEPAGRWTRANYSPLEAAGREALELRPAPRAWRDAARILIRRVQIGLSRRWRPGRRGRRFDLRRTWRASLQTGGEAVTARWLRRVHRSPRFVVLIDGSRSMSGTHQAAIDIAVALASVTRRVEVLAFSTGLISLTHQARRAGTGRFVRVEMSRDAWGGGTSIGSSLRTFLRLHGERHVGADTLVIIASDGLDVGEPRILRDAMRELHRRAAGVVWLNPLLDTPGYEPTSRGMMAARPFITTFTNVGDAEGLARLARLVRLRR